MINSATAQDTSSLQYQNALAERVRGVTDEVLPSVVGIEVIGVLQSDGEVRQDAPTSGIIIDGDGHILASSWVTRGPSASIIVSLGSGERFPARVVAEDEHRELVLLKIDPQNVRLQPITIPDPEVASDSYPAIGSTTVAVARYGEKNVPMVSTGVLSAVDRLDGTAVQSDVRISPVFYGGPLLDLRGNVLGVLIPAVGENGADDPTEWYDSGIA
ncbi:MAG: trypsin-like peptidase domain-containing protein, partial [Rhodopirellula sp. JB053]